MRINVKEYENEAIAPLPSGYRQTSALRETGERAMDDSNEAFILSELRSLESVTEGTIERYSWPLKIEKEGDWFFYNGCIVYKCDLSDEQFSDCLKNGWRLPDDKTERPVLDLLIQIKSNLEDYPVLDDDDYYERCHKAHMEMVEDSAPSNMPGRKDGNRLTEKQQSDIVCFLESDECDGKYAVEWSGSDDYYIGRWPEKEEGIYLEDCVKYACKTLKIWPHFRNPRRGR